MEPSHHPHQPESPPVAFRGTELRLAKTDDQDAAAAHPMSAATAWERFAPVLERTGVTRIADITQLDRIGIPVFNVLRPSLNGYSVAHGKGFTATAAKLSAAGESLERWYATSADIPAFRATWSELAHSYPMVPPERLALTPHSLFHRDLDLPWTLGWDIARQEEVPLPLELVRLSPGGVDRDLVDLSQGLLFQCSSNGLACGVHLLEAICQALLEVVERDSVTTCSLAARSRGLSAAVLRVAHLGSIPFPSVQRLLARIRAAGLAVLLADNGTDVGIPTWNCYLLDLEEPSSVASMAHGMGSALEHETAMIRAITEAVQGRCVLFSGVRDIFPSKEFRSLLSGHAGTALQILDSRIAERLDLGALEDRPLATFEADVHETMRRLAGVGLDRVIVFRLSAADDPVHAVKVFVPGAEGYLFPYYAPGARASAAMQHGMGAGSPLFREHD